MHERYLDRRDAGRRLAKELAEYADRSDVVVLGLPRGGVPVAAEVARALHAPLDVLVVRKLGLPGQPELAMGAIAAIAGTMVTVTNPDVMNSAAAVDVNDEAFQRVAAAEQAELYRRQHTYRGDKPTLDVRGRIVVLVDDGVATGATMRAAIAVIRPQHPQELVVAVPIGSRETCEELATRADRIVCVQTPDLFWAVGQGYLRFEQTEDAEVKRILHSPDLGISS